MIPNPVELFRGLADSDDDYVAEGDTLIFSHHGREHVLTLSHVPGIGTALKRKDTASEWVSASTFVQTEILSLPTLARQISKALEKRHREQELKAYIEGSADTVDDRTNHLAPKAKEALQKWLTMPGVGSTQLIELMAPAGQGKTVLLEKLAIDAANSYQPDPHPSPLLLVVDLLGRYVGTIHDAIAGSLNNTYMFPGLTGRDVSFCLRERWLVLALDGFDELVARVGTREAFLRTKELVDELDASGTVVLSARDTFFRLFEIDSSIRTYLQPKRGNYTIREFNLLPWDVKQAAEAFRQYGSRDPDGDLRQLLAAFSDGQDIVFRPFFTTRLIRSWVDGERFIDPAVSGTELDRWNYVIRIFLDREVLDKWRDRDNDSPRLPIDAHIAVLGAIAEEMWRSASFTLTREEVEIAARIALSDLHTDQHQIDGLVTRFPTHGILTISGNRSVKFLHESFYLYVLGHRLGAAWANENRDSVSAILKAGELDPIVSKWATWKINASTNNTTRALTWLASQSELTKDDHVSSNNVGILVGCLARISSLRDLELHYIQFIGESLAEVSLEEVKFKECSIQVANLSGAKFIGCEFYDCKLGTVQVDAGTVLNGSKFQDCEITGLEIKDGGELFAPDEIRLRLRSMGATIEDPAVPEILIPQKKQRRAVQRDVVHCLDKFRRAKTWDIALDDMEDRFGSIATEVARIGLENEVFRSAPLREMSGPRKTFFRFAVDRERLFHGQLGTSGDGKIDKFWSVLEEKFPADN